MKIGIITIAILIQINSFSQEIILGKTDKIPMQNGKVYGDTTPRLAYVDYSDGLTIRANNSDVFSLVDGQVSAVFIIDNKTAIVTRSSDSNFYSYTNLDTTYFSKGDIIKKGWILGKASESTDKHMYEIEMLIRDKNRFINQNEIWKIIQHANNTLLTSK
jgi:hypothetical protein